MKKKIMIVDDESDQILAVKKNFGGSDGVYEVIGADSGMQCIELLENNRIPDLILLDIMMPEMSGWEVFDKLRENPLWKDIPVVFLTARTDKIATDAGSFLAVDYIEKPYKIEVIKKRIDKVLRNTGQK